MTFKPGQPVRFAKPVNPDLVVVEDEGFGWIQVRYPSGFTETVAASDLALRFEVGDIIEAIASQKSVTGDVLIAGMPYEVTALDSGGWPIVMTDKHGGGGWQPGNFEWLRKREPLDSPEPLKEGDRVRHETLGEGRIVEPHQLASPHITLDRERGTAVVMLESGWLTEIALNLLTRVEPEPSTAESVIDDVLNGWNQNSTGAAKVIADRLRSAGFLASPSQEPAEEEFDDFDPVAAMSKLDEEEPPVEPQPEKTLREKFFELCRRWDGISAYSVIEHRSFRLLGLVEGHYDLKVEEHISSTPGHRPCPEFRNLFFGE